MHEKLIDFIKSLSVSIPDKTLENVHVSTTVVSFEKLLWEYFSGVAEFNSLLSAEFIEKGLYNNEREGLIPFDEYIQNEDNLLPVVEAMASADYDPTEIIMKGEEYFSLHLFTMWLCFSNLFKRIGGMDAPIIFRFTLSAAKLLALCGTYLGMGPRETSKIIRTSNSAITRRKSANDKYEEVISAFTHLSKTDPIWIQRHKDMEWKIKKIETYLNEQHGIGKGQKTYRSRSAIKKDLAEARKEGII